MYLGLTSIIALFIVILLNILRKYFKKIVSKKTLNPRGAHHLLEDKLIDTKTIDSNNTKKRFSTYKIYQTNSSKTDTIKRYIMSKDHKNLSLIYECGKNVNRVNILIHFYNKRMKLIYIYRVVEEVKSNYSKQIKIPKHTSYVNFVDYNDELESYYNKQLIRDRNLLIYDSISVFLMMFFISYWTVFILGGNLVTSYFNSFGIFMNLMLISIITTIYYTLNFNVILKRNPNI